MSRPDNRHGMALHGKAVAAALDIMADARRGDPALAAVALRLDVCPDALRGMFSDDRDLLVAVAEQALMRLMDACTRATVQVDTDDVVGQFLALGKAYVRWAADHQTEFRLISGNPTLDALGDPRLRRYLDAIVDLMMRMLERARAAGRLRENEDIPMIVLSSQTFAYGLAHMVIDGRMREWSGGGDPIDTAERAMIDFVRRFAWAAARRPDMAGA